MNAIAAEFNESVNKSFTPVSGNPVLILSNGMLKTVSLQNAYINALPCSSIQQKTSPIKCGVTLGSLKDFNTGKIICSKDCKKINETTPLLLEGGPV